MHERPGPNAMLCAVHAAPRKIVGTTICRSSRFQEGTGRSEVEHRGVPPGGQAPGNAELCPGIERELDQRRMAAILLLGGGAVLTKEARARSGTVIVGIQPEVAFVMVWLGLMLDGVATALDLKDGLAFLKRKG